MAAPGALLETFAENGTPATLGNAGEAPGVPALLQVVIAQNLDAVALWLLLVNQVAEPEGSELPVWGMQVQPGATISLDFTTANPGGALPGLKFSLGCWLVWSTTQGEVTIQADHEGPLYARGRAI